MSIQSTTVELTSAQIKALKETPQQIIAAPGTGFVNYIIALVAQYKAHTTPYTVPQNVEARFFYSGHNEASDDSVTVQIDQLLTPSVDTVQMGGPAPTLDSQSSFENVAILFGLFNDLGDVTDVSAGDGTLTLTVYYITVALSTS